MTAIVQEMKWGSDPDRIPVTPVSEAKEVLIGDEKEIIGSLPDIGPVEAATIFETSYYEPGVRLEGADNLASDIESDDQIFNLEKLSPGVLYNTLLKKYSDNFLEWEPETLRIVLKDDFELGDIPDNVWEAILATRVAGSGPTWLNWMAFEKASLAVSGSPVHPGTIQTVSVEEMAVLYKLMTSINPEGELSTEVERYIAARMYADNYLYCGGIFPSEIQNYIFELGAPKSLTDSVHEKVTLILDAHREGTKDLTTSIEELTHSQLDIQVARYISLL